MSKRPFVSDEKQSRKIFINNLRDVISVQDLTKLFLTYGEGEICEFSRQNPADKSNQKCIEISYIDPEDENRLLNDKVTLQEKYGFEFEVIGCRTLTFESPIEMLNDDCLFLIFEHLSQKERIGIERVCRKWREISLRSWTRDVELDFKKNFMMKPFRMTFLERLLRRCGSYLLNLDFTAMEIEDISPKEVFFLINSYCLNLTHLNLSNVHLIRDDLDTISVTVAEKLVILRLNSCLITDSMLSPLLVKAKNLCELSVCNNLISGKSLLNLAPDCLGIHAGNDPTDEKVVKFSSQFFNGAIGIDHSMAKKILERIPNLLFLEMYGCALRPKTVQPYSELLLQLGLNSNNDFFQYDYKSLSFPLLEQLSLSNIPDGDDAVLLHISAKCPDLTSLDISSFGTRGNLSDHGFKSLLNLNNLKALSINSSNITSETFEHLAVNSNGRFEYISCTNCHNLNGQAILKMIEFSPKLSKILVTCGIPVELDFFKSALNLVDARSNGISFKIFVDVSDTSPTRDLFWEHCGIFNNAVKFAREVTHNPFFKMVFKSFKSWVYEDCEDCQLISEEIEFEEYYEDDEDGGEEEDEDEDDE